MREIKFRAWDTETKEMSYDYLSKNWLMVCIESPYVELMQYTGLKDKNGAEIYEGDIVSHKHFEVGRTDIGKVVYHKSAFRVIHSYDTSEWGDGLYDCVYMKCEVIGNIYEHPHLLDNAVTQSQAYGNDCPRGVCE